MPRPPPGRGERHRTAHSPRPTFARAHSATLPFPSARAEPGGRFDLRREVAHNLALLYVNSGAPALARKVLRKFASV